MSSTVTCVPGAAGIDEPEGDVAGAARKIEHRERPVVFRRIDRRDQHVLPGAVEAARHQVVHQVITLRDTVKDVVDQCLLFVDGHVPEAEMSAFAGLPHLRILALLKHSARPDRALCLPDGGQSYA